MNYLLIFCACAHCQVVPSPYMWVPVGNRIRKIHCPLPLAGIAIGSLTSATERVARDGCYNGIVRDFFSF